MIGHFESAISKFDKIVLLCESGNSTDFYRTRANVEMEAGKFQKAADDYDQAIKEFPDDMKLRINRANCLEKLGENEKAFQEYSYMIQKDPSNPTLYTQRGYVSSRQKKNDLANADFAKAITLNPKDPQIYYTRALCSGSKGQYNDALIDLNTALKIKPTFVAGQALYRSWLPLAHKTASPAVAQSQIVARNLSGPIDDYISAVKKDPNNVETRRCLAYALLQNGHAPEAANQFFALKGVGALRSTDEPQFAKALAQSGSKQEAQAIYQHVVDNDPADLDARMGLARLYADFGQADMMTKTCLDGIKRSSSGAQSQRLASLMQSLNAQIEYSRRPKQAAAPDGSTANMVTAKDEPIKAVTAASQENITSQSDQQTQASLTTGLPQNKRRPLGNNELINPWAGFKGMQKKGNGI